MPKDYDQLLNDGFAILAAHQEAKGQQRLCYWCERNKHEPKTPHTWQNADCPCACMRHDPKRLTKPELELLKSLLTLYRGELIDCGAEEDASDAERLLLTINEDIRDNNR